MPKPLHRVVLGFDFGMRHIGVAVGQCITQTASPVTALKAQDGIPNWDHIRTLIDEWAADGLIVGVPYNMDGSDQPITLAARKFARRLQAHFQLPIYYVDERLTTFAANQLLTGRGKLAGKTEHADSIAAKIIVESWLAEHSSQNDA